MDLVELEDLVVEEMVDLLHQELEILDQMELQIPVVAVAAELEEMLVMLAMVELEDLE
jgi:hypothetical protein